MPQTTKKRSNPDAMRRSAFIRMQCAEWMKVHARNVYKAIEEIALKKHPRKESEKIDTRLDLAVDKLKFAEE